MDHEARAHRAEDQAARARESAIKARWAGDPVGVREWAEMAERREAMARELRQGGAAHEFYAILCMDAEYQETQAAECAWHHEMEEEGEEEQGDESTMNDRFEGRTLCSAEVRHAADGPAHLVEVVGPTGFEMHAVSRLEWLAACRVLGYSQQYMEELERDPEREARRLREEWLRRDRELRASPAFAQLSDPLQVYRRWLLYREYQLLIQPASEQGQGS